MISARYENRSLIPIVHADGRVEVRPYVWEIIAEEIPPSRVFNSFLIAHIFVHEDSDAEDRDILGLLIKTPAVDIVQSKHFVRRWNSEESLENEIEKSIRHFYRAKEDEKVVIRRGYCSVTMLSQALAVNHMPLGFNFGFTHNEDYNPECAVCTESTAVINTILGDWLKDAVLVEQDFAEQTYFKINDLKKVIILKPSDKPKVARLLEWFCENFADTIKLASIEKIQFQEYGINRSYDCIIEY